jgi:Type IV secretion-system coupling protein DNA-binding domain
LIRSNDPAANAAIATFLVIAGIVLVIVGGAILLPIVLLVLIAKGLHWYFNREPRKTPLNILYEAALVQAKQVPDGHAFAHRAIGKVMDAWEADGGCPTLDVAEALAVSLMEIYENERLAGIPSPPKYPDALSDAQYREALTTQLGKINQLPALEKTMVTSCVTFANALPEIARQKKETPNHSFQIPLSAAVKPAIITDLVRHYYAAPLMESGICSSLRDTLDANLHKLSGVKMTPETRNFGELLMPEEFKGTTAEAVDVYLADTPLHQVFNAQISFTLPEETRFAGHWIVAPPGRGKTTLLHAMVNDDLTKDAAIVLIDSKGDLIEPFRQLKSIKDRLLLIEPRPDSALTLNPLDVTHTTVVQAVSLIEYIMAGLLDAKFTALQSTLFRNVVPAIIEAIPNPTLDTFKEVMTKGLPSLDKLNPHARQFFENRETGFRSKTYESTRKEIVWRLDYLMTNPVLRSMFSAPHTNLDMRKEMDAGKVVIVNNSKSILGDEGAEFFGRFFVALIARAAQQRTGRPPASKKPCFVYIDECQSVISKDTRIPILLDECRSQKIALILSHQRTAQLTAPVLDAAANCAIRMANSDDEAKFLADKLRMNVDTLRSLPRGTFGAFVRDLTPAGIQVRITKPDLDSLPKMDERDLQAIRDRLRNDVSAATEDAAPLSPSDDAAIADPTVPADVAPTLAPHQEDPGEPSTSW